MKTILGSPTRLIPMESLRFMPPESSLALAFRQSCRLTSWRVAVTFQSQRLAGTPLSRAQKQRCSSTVRVGQRMSNCGQTPIWRCTWSIESRMLWPATQAWPWEGPKIPVIIDNSVVLPAPLGPSSPKIVLSSTFRLKRSTASFPESYRFERSSTTRAYWPKSSIWAISCTSSSTVASFLPSRPSTTWCTALLRPRPRQSSSQCRGNSRGLLTPNSWGTTQKRYIPRRAKRRAEVQRTAMQVVISGVRASRVWRHWSIEQQVKRRQKRRVKAKVGQREMARGCWTGNWNMATLRVAPTRLVQMATRQPMMLAALLEDRNTCRKTDSPICARIQPSMTTARRRGLVCRKKEMSRKNQPQRQKTRLVARLMSRLQRQLIPQQLRMPMPFMRIIWISFSSFYSTTRYRNTGSSSDKANGNIIVAIAFMRISTSPAPSLPNGMQVQPAVKVRPVSRRINAFVSMSITVSSPSGIMKKLLKRVPFSTSARIRISLMPVGRQNRNSRTSFTLTVAYNLEWFTFLKLTAPSGRWQAELVSRRAKRVSLLRNQNRSNSYCTTELLDYTNSGGIPQLPIASGPSRLLLTMSPMLAVVGMCPSSPQAVKLMRCPMQYRSAGSSHSQSSHCPGSLRTISSIWSARKKSLSLEEMRGSEAQMVLFWLGMLSIAALRIRIVKNKQMIGVSTWHTLVHG